MPQARFLEGSTMSHVIRMTLTGAAALTFMFLIDTATLFWISRLRDEALMAALGFAWTIQFFIISTGIGLAIATTALVSRAFGEGDIAGARRLATASVVITLASQVLLVVAVMLWRRTILHYAGASGATLDIADRFLVITLPSMPLMAIGMCGGAILRAIGDAWRAMLVTMIAGIVAMLLDPVFIFWLDLGIDGAAWVMLIARVGVGVLALWYLIGAHRILGRVGPGDLKAILHPFGLIAVPAIMTQMSTPFGNALLTHFIAAFGDGAVAGFAVISRLTVLAFGGIFALSGAIGGILGQNYGAGLMPRVRRVYRDSVLFCFAYTLAAWAILFATRERVVELFRLGHEGAVVIDAFVGIAAGGFVFTGALFVANSAFNTLGKPLWSTGFNWARDGFVLLPFAWAMSRAFGAPGVLYGQAAAGVVVGTIAAWAGWRFVAGLMPARLGVLETGAEDLHHRAR
ncbi:MATE family efflux transporter [Amaricoccus solimangrovi]|uniref:Multidrug transporter n=1 Tax=Amaricoccus solimangrovi TaxID=2589815 RepID=A0A501WZG5_9RHOB|nr:MATE family efflux transporter [Amaricoccus solimangrovi]TPE53775.1 multidrug transporter [Amaricoccus solimangrovi]